MPLTYRLSALAYLKLVLHSAKYSVNQVCGVLIGRKVSNAADAAVEVTDAIPLFHSHPLAPMLEVAMQQVQAYCDQKSLQIVGLYAANQSLANKDVSPTTAKIASKIEDNLGYAALLLMLDASKLEDGNDKAVTPYSQTSGGWTVLQSNHLIPPIQRIDLPQIISDRTYNELHDFDNHLDNIKLDWLSNNVAATALKA
ncbi:hypothetical protein DFJ77DRAFT_139768 [Powellomyces hirtus]|nr:hypothetical protein DFJ77DRAFT_139768 [Powellomyces hirtus]